MPMLRQWANTKYGAEKVREKIEAILAQTKESNFKNMSLRISQRKTLDRLESLAGDNRNLEYINTGFPLVEYGMKRLIVGHEFVINSSLVMGDFDTPLKIRERGLGDGNNAFGNLLHELERFYEKGEAPLLGLLTNFNSKKQRSSHKLYEKNIDPEEVNGELKTYVQDSPITKIMDAFDEEHAKLVASMINKLAEYGYVVESPADEAALEKEVLGLA